MNREVFPALGDSPTQSPRGERKGERYGLEEGDYGDRRVYCTGRSFRFTELIERGLSRKGEALFGGIMVSASMVYRYYEFILLCMVRE